MTDRELMQQALEMIEDARNGSQRKPSEPVITALRERLAQPEQERDYRTRYDRGCYKCGSHYCPADCPEPTHLVRQQPQMQPCVGRNCGSTNPNLHSAECFEDYEKSTGMSQWQSLTEEEINNSYLFWIVDQQDVFGFGKSIETKLKRKNT